MLIYNFQRNPCSEKFPIFQLYDLFGPSFSDYAIEKAQIYGVRRNKPINCRNKFNSGCCGAGWEKKITMILMHVWLEQMKLGNNFGIRGFISLSFIVFYSPWPKMKNWTENINIRI